MIRDGERTVFDGFCRAAGLKDSFGCSEGGDPPDFLCVDSGGGRVGVELAEWVNERQIAASKPRLRIRVSIDRAVRSLEVPCQSLGRILLFAKSEARDSDVPEFRRQLVSFVGDIERSWASYAKRPTLDQGIPVRTFAPYDLLQTHLSQIDVFPRKQEVLVSIGVFWGGGPHSTRSALEALLCVTGKKLAKYGSLHAREMLNELWLVLYYSQGHIYNTPYDSPSYGFRDVAADLTSSLQCDHGPFQRVYLYDYPRRQLQCVWP